MKNRILAGLLVLCLTACPVAAGAAKTAVKDTADSVGSLSPQGAQAYLDVIGQLEAAYGKASQAGNSSMLPGLWQGLSLTRLIDFDGDGVPELYCGMSMPGLYGRSGDGQRLYTWDGALRQLSIPASVSNGGGVEPLTRFYVGEGVAYLSESGSARGGSSRGRHNTYYTKRGNEMTSVLTLSSEGGEGDPFVYKMNGSVVTKEEHTNAEKELLAGTVLQIYYYVGSGSDSPKGTVAATVAALTALASPKAQPSGHRLTIDGMPCPISAYEIGGNNYFKLRDVAQLLSGSDAQFEVTWNGAQKRIELTSDRAYTPAGGELGGVPASPTQARATGAAVCLDGRELSLTAYEIGGNNYFKLRDLGEALDFYVGWDSENSTVQIDTHQGYKA